jgi:hypothetical protein
MPRVRIASGGWTSLAVESQQPAHMTNERGEVIDLDGMLRALHLMRTDFNGAPSHRPKVVRDPDRCSHGHPWAEYEYHVPGGYRICRKCKDDSRLRARASAKASHERRKSAQTPHLVGTRRSCRNS